jgi:hypothetical protein
MTTTCHNPYCFNEKTYNFGVSLFEFRKNSPKCCIGKSAPQTGWCEKISEIIGYNYNLY